MGRKKNGSIATLKHRTTYRYVRIIETADYTAGVDVNG